MWRNYQRDAAERGVKLRFEDYDTPLIPDDDNYAAAPIFRKLFADPNNLKPLLDQLELPNRISAKANDLAPDPFGLREWQTTFVAKKWIASAGPEPAVDVLKVLQKMETPLSEIRLASTRSKCRWPIKWSEGAGAWAPMYGIITKAGAAFALRSRCFLALDRPDEALAELRYIIRASESIEVIPMVISGLVRDRLWNQILDVVEEGIQTGKWKTSHLNELSRRIQKENHLANWVFSLNGERCLITYVMDRLATAPP